MREFEDDPEVDKDNAAPVRTVANSAVEGTDCLHEYHKRYSHCLFTNIVILSSSWPLVQLLFSRF